VRGISGGDPTFRADDGSADPAVSAALAAYAAGAGSEHAALTALAASRLLVPVVAEVAGGEGAGGDSAGAEGTGSERAGGESAGGESAGGEKGSDMALPTLIGLDGRRAIPAFTSLAAMARWRADARPVPTAALGVWQAAAEDSCAVVIDVGGPVPFAVEGARLAALARGEGPPEAWADPDVQEAIAGVLSSRIEVAAFDLRPGGADHDLAIALSLAPGQSAGDVTGLAGHIGDAVFARLGGRLRRGVAIWLGAIG
jgi:SseB protein N-terminal domain